MDYELYHHGIIGMKWGVRRFQNPDGSLTAAGKKRYGSKITIERPHKAQEVVDVTHPSQSSGGSGESFDSLFDQKKSIKIGDKEVVSWTEKGAISKAIEKARKFIDSLFDQKTSISIGGKEIVSYTKKGEISKAIDKGREWLNNVFSSKIILSDPRTGEVIAEIKKKR